jgi:hypothetical protein
MLPQFGRDGSKHILDQYHGRKTKPDTCTP